MISLPSLTLKAVTDALNGITKKQNRATLIIVDDITKCSMNEIFTALFNEISNVENRHLVYHSTDCWQDCKSPDFTTIAKGTIDLNFVDHLVVVDPLSIEKKEK